MCSTPYPQCASNEFNCITQNSETRRDSNCFFFHQVVGRGMVLCAVTRTAQENPSPESKEEALTKVKIT